MSTGSTVSGQTKTLDNSRNWHTTQIVSMFVKSADYYSGSKAGADISVNSGNGNLNLIPRSTEQSSYISCVVLYKE